MFEGVGCGDRQTLRGRSRRGRVTMAGGECVDDGDSLCTARRTVFIDLGPMFSRRCCVGVVEAEMREADQGRTFWLWPCKETRGLRTFSLA